ncbi:hypothetical protein B0I35DRAFT_473223 [Stachybotrys elegans]|uniref:Polyprenal reductase n=1 Tax=Stachybotrys elegans TaxID=80388 RepID=A0A8K0WWC4_9HYPO|nr:hypothetical protein B0I35DRAFT_473223 [Stachybotrys elegans]
MDLTQSLVGHLQALSPAGFVQSAFVLAAALVLAVQAAPASVRTAMTEYGARSRKGGTKGQEDTHGEASLHGLLIYLTRLGQVPHQWFLHFYVASVAWSIFWAVQLVWGGAVLTAVAARQAQTGGTSMTTGQVYLAWTLMALQGVRRLYESLFVTRPGSSPMWIVHWALGVVYYTGVNVAVWVEGSGAILDMWNSSQPVQLPWTKAIVGTAVYLAAYWYQYQCHSHLASLKKYTLPERGLFQYIVCPHYTCDCVIYLGIAIATAPEGYMLNRTVTASLLFAAVNLGATAAGTKQWYGEKFGHDKIRQKWTMIPPVF